MSELILIVYDIYKSSEKESKFAEVLASNFVSKKVRNNAYAIVNAKKLDSSEIFKIINSKLDIDANFLVIKLEDFYGIFNDDGVLWMKEQQPTANWLDGDKGSKN